MTSACFVSPPPVNEAFGFEMGERGGGGGLVGLAVLGAGVRGRGRSGEGDSAALIEKVGTLALPAALAPWRASRKGLE